jgi:carboxylesterase type B
MSLEAELIGLKRPRFETVVFDEFNCLNLNITAPANLHAEANIPVMIYIHGGGGFYGGNSAWYVDGGSLVRQSIISGRPVIQVAIKYVSNVSETEVSLFWYSYRLSVFGFIGSEELRRENGLINGGNYGMQSIRQRLVATY